MKKAADGWRSVSGGDLKSTKAPCEHSIAQGAPESKENSMSLSNDAIVKLRAEEKNGTYDRYAAIMEKSVLEKLVLFCEQNEEFAEAVLQGSTFEECMKAVAQGCGTGLSDLEAYKRAAGFYFKGADVQMQLTIRLAGDRSFDSGCASAQDDRSGRKPIILNLEDFI